MHDPIKMVVVSLLGSLTLILFLIIYRFVFPKKKINLLVLLILISLLPLISILRPGSYESGDLSEHVKLTMMFYNELTQGNWIPSWTDLGCTGYGCPVFTFIYTFPYYLISFIHTFGLSFVASTKLFLAVTFIASGMTMYLWMKDELGKTAGFIAGIFYLFAPYHLVDLHFRNAVGEMAAFAVLPLCFYFTRKIIIQKKNQWIVFNAIALSLLVLSHLTATLIAFPLLFCYAFILLLHQKNKLQTLLLLITSFILCLLFTSFYWLPVAFEGKFIYWGVHGSVSFYPLADLLFSPWRYGLLFQGPHGEHSHLVGYIHLLIISLSGILLFKKTIKEKSSRALAWFFFVTFVFSFIMILPITKIIWEIVPLISGFQFSYRLLIFSSFSSAVLAAIVLKNIKNKKLVILICCLTIGITILNWGNRKAVATINDSLLHTQAFYTDTVASPITGPIWMNNSPQYWYERITKKDKLISLSKNNEIIMLDYSSKKRTYLIAVKEDSEFVEQTFYYPNWQITANKKMLTVNNMNQKYPGLLSFKLTKGTYYVEIVLKDTNARKLGKYISFISIIYSIFLLLVWVLKKETKGKN